VWIFKNATQTCLLQKHFKGELSLLLSIVILIITW
jgi:hypothetical protein